MYEIVQFILLFTFVFVYDAYLQVRFKGEDHRQENQERKQLDEYPDVVAHRDMTLRTWEDPGMLI